MQTELWNVAAGGVHPVSAPDLLPEARLQEAQLRRLRAVVGRAHDHVPLFRQRLEKLGLTPDGIRGLADIAKLPFTVKTDLRDTYPFGLFASPMGDLVRLHASSIIGPGVASECSAQDGLHVFEDHFYPEIIDPESGEPLPDGEEGELVLTTLSKKAMPMIRYRTRDITRIIAEPCTCGRTLRRIQRIGRRSDDMRIIRGVNVFPSQIEEALRERIGREIHTVPGIRAEVELAEPRRIERCVGKAKRVLDRRGIEG